MHPLRSHLSSIAMVQNPVLADSKAQVDFTWSSTSAWLGFLCGAFFYLTACL